MIDIDAVVYELWDDSRYQDGSDARREMVRTLAPVLDTARGEGAAVAFGLLGMAEAIRTRNFNCPRCGAENVWNTACCWRCNWEPDERGEET